jgi:hypothetical protein
MFDPHLLFIVNVENELVPYYNIQFQLETVGAIILISMNVIIISIITILLYTLLEISGVIKTTINFVTQLFYYLVINMHFLELLTAITSIITCVTCIAIVIKINNEIDNIIQMQKN